MASLGSAGFDSTTIEPSAGFALLPPGPLPMVIVASEEKRTQDGKGSYIALTIQVDDGPMKGRKIWENLNLDNPSQEAVNIAKATLSAICRAVGVPRPKDTQELHFKRFTGTIVHKKNKRSNEIEARIGKYEPAAGASPASFTPPAAVPPAAKWTPPATQAAPATDTPPWIKKAMDTAKPEGDGFNPPQQ